MDDLLGEDWQAPAKPSTTTPLHPTAFASNLSSYRASPQLSQPLRSGAASPLNSSQPSSAVNGAAKPASDSFGNLLSLKSQKAGSNLSIQERQRQLAEEKREQQAQHSQLWETLGSGRGTPETRGPSTIAPPKRDHDDDDDILAAFNKAAPVDNASHFPPPASNNDSGRNTPAVTYQVRPAGTGGFDEDDDPFELAAASKKSNGHARAPATQSSSNEDDILGDLSKPISEKPAQRAAEPVSHVDSVPSERSRDEHQDQALAELVDMGFPTDTAKIALVENGGDVHGAVGWLLQQAHEESKQKARAETQARHNGPQPSNRSPSRRQHGEQDNAPAWMRQEARSSSGTRRQDSGSPANGEKDPTQMAQELGNKLFKGANSLWKASQKQMAKTMAEFQQERDPTQPKWMQDVSGETSRTSSQRRQEERKATQSTTDAVAMLDAPRESRPVRPARSTTEQRPNESPAGGRSPVEPLPYRPSAQPPPKFTQQSLAQADRRPASKLSRQEVEDQSAQAYVSPARRKQPTPKPEPLPEPEVDLFSPAPTPAVKKPASRPSLAPRPSPAPPRPNVPPRSVPSISAVALSSSTQHRKAGGDAFKRGDYAAAHESYTSALTPIPAGHPIMIIILCNRSLTALKTGDAKTAVSDADRALEIIGVSQGVGESIELDAGEGVKDMKKFYGKALMRKAEALEHMEKWFDAAAVWRQAINAGIGGAVSLRGRDRCEKAAAPTKPAQALPKPVRSSAPGPGRAPPAKGLGNSLQRPTITSAVSAEAVKKLRAANAAAEKADDEKFALTDQVDARLTAWKDGKSDNLRALLQSLDGVLWEGAGWKKVGMSDLVVPNKVKIVYMKAIGRVHPDKVSFCLYMDSTVLPIWD